VKEKMVDEENKHTSFYQEQWTANESNDGRFNSIGGITKDAKTRNNGVGV
jgi:hypothetical protein